MPSPIHHLAGHATRRFLNIKLGWHLMRDPRVAVAKKALALVLGIGITVALIALEVPLEGLVALVAPLVGGGIDLMIDGAEVVIFPLIIALAILPFLVKERQLIRVENEI